jgi:hypothetical protein
MLSKVVINAVNFMFRGVYPFNPVSYSMVCSAVFWVKTSSESSQEKKKLKHKLLVVARPSFRAHLPNRKPSARRRFLRSCEGVSHSRDLPASSER